MLPASSPASSRRAASAAIAVAWPPRSHPPTRVAPSAAMKLRAPCAAAATAAAATASTLSSFSPFAFAVDAWGGFRRGRRPPGSTPSSGAECGFVSSAGSPSFPGRFSTVVGSATPPPRPSRVDRQRSSFSSSSSSPPSVGGTDEDDPDDAAAAPISPGEYATSYHAPVMVTECVDALLVGRDRDSSAEPDRTPRRRRPPMIFVDGTLGGGGHSAALLSRLRSGDVVVGCDVDPAALSAASDRLRDYAAAARGDGDGRDDRGPTFIPVRTNFRDLDVALSELRHPITGERLFVPDDGGDDDGDDRRGDDDGRKGGAFRGVDGMLLDLGVSSRQIDDPDRGFAFLKDGPLDMRMSRGEDDDSDEGGGLTAADVCNEFDEAELTRIFKRYGDEPRARKIARSVVDRRPLSKTSDLVDAISDVVPPFSKKGRRLGRTATLARVFQSLRIVVNEEDRALGEVLVDVAPGVVRRGGRLAVLSYHSLEDRAVKRVMRDGALERRRGGGGGDERDIYGNYVGAPKPWKVVGKRRKATEEEVASNPRARSAVLRVAEKT